MELVAYLIMFICFWGLGAAVAVMFMDGLNIWFEHNWLHYAFWWALIPMFVVIWVGRMIYPEPRDSRSRMDEEHIDG